MQMWPDWNKLYAKWECLYYWVAFSDEQWKALDNAKNESDREDLVRKFREEYMANRDLLTGEVIKKEEIKEDPIPEIEPIPEESIEDVKPVKKTKKGK